MSRRPPAGDSSGPPRLHASFSDSPSKLCVFKSRELYRGGSERRSCGPWSRTFPMSGARGEDESSIPGGRACGQRPVPGESSRLESLPRLGRGTRASAVRPKLAAFLRAQASPRSCSSSSPKPVRGWGPLRLAFPPAGPLATPLTRDPMFVVTVAWLVGQPVDRL